MALTVWLPSVVATSAFLVPLTRRTAAPWPGHSTVLLWTQAVVLLVDPVAAREVGAAEQRDQDRGRVHAALGQPVLGRERDARGRRLAPSRRGRGQAVVDDRLAGEGLRGNAGDLRRAGVRAAVGADAALDDGDVAVGGDAADQGDRDAPALADLAHGRVVLRPAGGQHPLLRLGDHHFPGRHAGLAARDRVEVQEDAGAGLVGRLGGGAADPAGAEVLDALDEAAVDQLQAGLDQQLLGERVADLDRGPLVRVVSPRTSPRRARWPRRCRRARSWSRTGPRSCPGPAPRPGSASAPRAGRWP